MQIGPKSNDISAYGLTNAVKSVNTLRNLDFGSNSSFTYDASGIHVLTKSSSTVANPFEYHFEVVANAASNTVDVHAGRWLRYYDGYESGGDGNLKITKLTTTDGSSTSGKYENIYTLSGLTNNASNFIIVKLDDPFNPTSLIPEIATSYPTSSLFDRTRRVIACANVSSTGTIVDIEPYVDGGDITDEMTYANDNCSIGRNANDNNEIWQFSNASSTSVINDSDQIIKKSVGGCVSRSIWSGMKQDVIDDVLADPDFCTSVQNCINNSAQIICDLIEDNCPLDLDHSQLGDLVANTGTDEHNGGPATTQGNFPYVSGRQNGGSRIANRFYNGVFLADINGNARIYPNECILQSVGVQTVNWANFTLKNGADGIAVDWDQGLLANTTWSTTSDFIVGTSLDVTTFANVGSYLGVTGFVSADKFKIGDDPIDNYWDADNFKVSVSANIDLYAIGTTTLGKPASSQIVISDEVLNLYPSAGGMLQIDGVECKGSAAYCVVDPNTGDMHSITFTKGLVTSI